MPKRTKKQSLIRCRKIWQWLAEHPNQPKESAYAALRLLPDDRYLCPACEYKETHNCTWDGKADSCDRDCILDWYGKNCLSSNSQYWRWANAILDIRVQVRTAKQIVALCDKALAALPARRRTK